MRMGILSPGYDPCRDNPHGQGLRRHRKHRRYADRSTGHRLGAAAVAARATAAVTVSGSIHAGCHDHLGHLPGHAAGLDRGRAHAQGHENAQQQREYLS